MKSKSFLFPHLFYAGAILIVGLVLVGIFFYLRDKELKIKAEEFRVKQAQEESDRLKSEAEKATRKKGLDDCLTDVSARFEELSTNPSTRYQTAEGVRIILDEFNNQKELCFKKYPQ